MARSGEKGAARSWDVFVVVERPITGRAPFWLKVGEASETKDGGIAVTLDAFPKDGRCILRPRP
jgi:hypothetical protein